MEPKIFYISDLHIGHANAISFDNRPFKDLDEMHCALIHNWNSVVRPQDSVYILGDVAWKNDIGLKVISKLNGVKYLIKGNHDHLNAELASQFKWVKELETVRDNGRKVVLCHYPIAHWKNSDYGYYHLYGHIHTGRDARPFEEYVSLMRKRGLPYRAYNVGCMLPYMNYTPRTLDEIVTGYNNCANNI